MEKFCIKYTGHERAARKILLRLKIKPVDDLALMSAPEIEQAINARFDALECGENWLLVPKEKQAEFQALITWVAR